MAPTNQSILRLPRDILFQILLLLPLEAILYCKRVSKEFKNLIAHPNFFSIWRDSSLVFFESKRSDDMYCVLTSRREGNSNIYGGRGINPPISVQRLPFHFPPGDHIHEFLSEPSKGIAWVVTKRCRVFFYNFFAGACYAIPEVPLFLFSNYINNQNGESYMMTKGPRNQYSRSIWRCYGFGYDGRTDDFKMMVAYKRDDEWLKWCSNIVDINKIQNEEVSQFWVYSLRSRGWRSFTGLPSFDGRFGHYKPRAYSFGGVLHWVVNKKPGNENSVILTYDLSSGRFGEMLLPPLAYRQAELGELDGSLCWSNSNESWTRLCVWTKTAATEPWTMFLSIDYARLSGHSIGWIRPVMIYECADGRKVVLFVCKYYGTLYLYDIENDTMTRIRKSVWEKRRKPKRKILARD